ncbi:sporulation protein YunB [Paenibacillus sp. SYP-B3998]|uniref:Sporulation protein YunB n=1 Tax=Paenibacillus sp. SYP-B3998 TaxID=2678564 RepID=A0A6G4A1P1_9BACL|nr:sporulation protein YunB [Paenibacillus sp. SYP-B3998]NEW08406.1 sporulation protein YunB [Paenibacillus sp. SYP-B3998]
MRRRRWRSRPTGKTSRKRVLLIGLLILVLFVVQSFMFVERNLRPPLMNLAKIRIKQIATQAINSAIANHIAGNTNAEKLIDWKTDKNGKITGFMLNYAEHMRITSDTIKTVQGELNNLQSINEHIPIGQAMNSAILASFGPDVPIKLLPVGNVKVDLNTRSQNAGINMVLFEVYVRIIAEVSVIIPFDSDTEIVETEIPISYSLVVGDVPTYYFDSKGNPVGSNKDSVPPNLSLPSLPNGGATVPNIDNVVPKSKENKQEEPTQ